MRLKAGANDPMSEKGATPVLRSGWLPHGRTAGSVRRFRRSLLNSHAVEEQRGAEGVGVRVNRNSQFSADIGQTGRSKARRMTGGPQSFYCLMQDFIKYQSGSSLGLSIGPPMNALEFFGTFHLLVATWPSAKDRLLA